MHTYHRYDTHKALHSASLHVCVCVCVCADQDITGMTRMMRHTGVMQDGTSMRNAFLLQTDACASMCVYLCVCVCVYRPASVIARGQQSMPVAQARYAPRVPALLSGLQTPLPILTNHPLQTPVHAQSIMPRCAPSLVLHWLHVNIGFCRYSCMQVVLQQCTVEGSGGGVWLWDSSTAMVST